MRSKNKLTLAVLTVLSTAALAQPAPKLEYRIPLAKLKVTAVGTPAPSPAPAQGAGSGSVTTSATSLSFPDTRRGQVSEPMQFLLTNEGTGTVTDFVVDYGPQEDFLVTTTCPSTLAPGATCVVSVRFTPTTDAPNPLTGLVYFYGTNLNPSYVEMSISGSFTQGELVIAPNNGQFQATRVGDAGSRVFSVTNQGTARAENVRAQIIAQDVVNYSITANTCGTQEAPGALNIGQSCSVTVRFAPQQPNRLTAQLDVRIDGGAFGPGRGADLQLEGEGIPVKDPFFNNVSFLMTMNGVPGTQTFTETKGTPVTTLGGTVVDNTVVKSQQSAKFVPSSPLSALTLPDSAAVQLGSSNFTLEGWVYPKNQVFAPIGKWSASNNRSWIILNGTTSIDFLARIGSDRSIVSAPALPINTWSHIAITRSGNTWCFYVNGALPRPCTTEAGALQPDVGEPIVFGKNNNNQLNGLDGWMDDWRLTKGIARYAGPFMIELPLATQGP